MTTVRFGSVVCVLAVLISASFEPTAAGTRPQGYVGSESADLSMPISTELESNATLGVSCYVALFTDADRCSCSVYGQTGVYPFTMWVWWYPTEEGWGMQGAEFAIQYPSNVIAHTVTQNPAIAAAVGDLSTGVSVAFGECQTGWTWTHQQQCYLNNVSSIETSYIEVVPHTVTNELQIAPCELGYAPTIQAGPDYVARANQITPCELRYPFVPATVLTHIVLNGDCGWHYPELPELVGVTVQSTSAVRALFNMCVTSSAVTYDLVLHNKANPLDSIYVTHATWVDDDAYDLVLQRAMADSTTYVLVARNAVWSCSFAFANHSEFEFTFYQATATKETSWGAIKALFKN